MPEHIDFIAHENVDWVAEHVVRYWYAAREIQNGQTVVDAACGAGYGTELLSWRTPSVRGYDRNADEIHAATRRWPNIHFESVDLDTFELPSADVLVSFETIEHLKSPERFVNQFNKFSTVFFSTPHIPTKRNNEFHLHDFNSDIIRSWFEGWNISWLREQHCMYTLLRADKRP